MFERPPRLDASAACRAACRGRCRPDAAARWGVARAHTPPPATCGNGGGPVGGLRAGRHGRTGSAVDACYVARRGGPNGERALCSYA